ncbi:hypothetical protein [Zoogloea sp.]|uniref:hypothetical protein n=1 Tax=Zoogloea sp. TaxID=49181 RepID=UPI0037D9C317
MTHHFHRPIAVFAFLVGAYFLVLSPALFWPSYLDSPVGVLVALPYLSVYLFHALGVPGLLVNDGACGWGWCAPTVFGWCFIVAFWLGLAWLVALGLVRWRGRGVSP